GEDPKNHWHALLKLSGLVLSRGGMLELRNRIYHSVFDKAWISDHMPDVELQRHRRAYQKGLIRAIAAMMGLLLLTAASFVINDVLLFRRTMIGDLKSQAQFLGSNSKAALAFNSEQDAAAILASSKAKPPIVFASLYDGDGKRFASYVGHEGDISIVPQ